MSSITTYKCDRCGATSTDKNELNLLWVGVGVKSENYGSYDGGYGTYELIDANKRKMEMCEKCLKELGLIAIKKERQPNEKQPVYPTLEDMIREIIRQEVTP